MARNVENLLTLAAIGEADALFDLGLVYANGEGAAAPDLVEAHKWFNLAALNGVAEAQECRADVAENMTAREIAEAQRQARSWLALTAREMMAA